MRPRPSRLRLVCLFGLSLSVLLGAAEPAAVFAQVFRQSTAEQERWERVTAIVAQVMEGA